MLRGCPLKTGGIAVLDLSTYQQLQMLNHKQEQIILHFGLVTPCCQKWVPLMSYLSCFSVLPLFTPIVCDLLLLAADLFPLIVVLPFVLLPPLLFIND